MTNKKISKIGLGTVQFGIPYGISNKNGQTSENEVEKILNYAKKTGINVLDTASTYGTSEKVLGKNNLTEFKIVSKFLLKDNQKSISKQLKQSLTDLNVESLYGYIAHRPLEIANKPELWNELSYLKKQGTIKKIGFSFNEFDEIKTLLSLKITPDIIQVPYNYLDNRFEPYMKELKKKGCEIHTRSAFLQGLFFSDTNQLNTFFNDVKPIIKQLQEHGDYLPGLLLNYCTEKPFIDKVIFGINTLSQLKSNINNLSIINTLSLPLRTHTIDESILIPSKWPKLIKSSI